MFSLDTLPIRRRTWIQIASLPKARIGWELTDCKDVPTEALDSLSKWLTGLYKGNVVTAVGRQTCGLGLLLYGLPGRGKTTVAVTLLQEIMRTATPEALKIGEGKTLVRPCYFITFNSLLDLKGALMDEQTESDKLLYDGILGESLDDAYNVRVLVLDDVGKEHASLSGWQKSMLHHVLRTRYNNGLPTIVTTNVELKNWSGLYGEATESFANEAFMYLNMDNISDLRR